MELQSSSQSNSLMSSSGSWPTTNNTFMSSVFSIGSKMGNYVWLSDEQMMLPDFGRGSIIFEAKAQNDIHICFNNAIKSKISGQEGISDSPVYEVVIGICLFSALFFFQKKKLNFLS